MAEVPMRRVMWATVAGVALLAVGAIVWSAVKGAPGTVPPPPRHTAVVPQAGTAPAPGAGAASAPKAGGPTAAAAKTETETLAGVTPVSGESWVTHLKVNVAGAPYGRQGGLAPPPASAASREHLDGRFLLTGADLYRLDCQSCHGPKGTGAPPSINSLIGPVEATRPELMKQRLAKAGHTLPDKLLEQMASQSRALIVKRLHDGGKNMPAFAHLDPAEVDALIDYLQRLVGPVSRMPVTLSEPPVRVGEHLVKGTCHICHAATGPGGHGVALHGGVPSLASFAHDYDLRAIVAKVRSGIPAGMMGGRGGMMGGGRGMMGRRGGMAPAGGWKMPVLPYLTPNELAAAVEYLKQDPPRP